MTNLSSLIQSNRDLRTQPFTLKKSVLPKTITLKCLTAFLEIKKDSVWTCRFKHHPRTSLFIANQMEFFILTPLSSNGKASTLTLKSPSATEPITPWEKISRRPLKKPAIPPQQSPVVELTPEWWAGLSNRPWSTSPGTQISNSKKNPLLSKNGQNSWKTSEFMEFTLPKETPKEPTRENLQKNSGTPGQSMASFQKPSIKPQNLDGEPMKKAFLQMLSLLNLVQSVQFTSTNQELLPR